MAVTFALSFCNTTEVTGHTKSDRGDEYAPNMTVRLQSETVRTILKVKASPAGSHLLPGVGERRGLGQVALPDAAPASAVVGHRHRGLDELVVHHVSIVGHYAAACQMTDAAFGACAHHLTVDSEVFGWVYTCC